MLSTETVSVWPRRSSKMRLTEGAAKPAQIAMMVTTAIISINVNPGLANVNPGLADRLGEREGDGEGGDMQPPLHSLCLANLSVDGCLLGQNAVSECQNMFWAAQSEGSVSLYSAAVLIVG